MKILSLLIENVKRIKALQINPDGNLIVVGGKNEQGKSSTLDAIMYALGGKKKICEQPLRRGSEKGKVVCDIEDFIITRTFTEKGGSLIVAAKDTNARFQSPQAILDQLTGTLSFDPLDFKNQDPMKQLQIVKTLTGLDLQKQEDDYQTTYNERAEVNRAIKTLKMKIEEMEISEETPKDPILISSLMDELEKRQKINEDNADIRASLETLNEKTPILVGGIKDTENDIINTQAEIDALTTQKAHMINSLENLQEILSIHENEIDEKKLEVESLEDKDTEEIKEKIKDAQRLNKLYDKKQEKAVLEQTLESEIESSKSHTATLDAIKTEKTNIMAEAKFPIDGLSFDETGVTYKDLPFKQASGSQQLRVSVAIGLAMNPKLRVLLIRDGSLLDEDNLKMVAEMAQEADAQVWLERVGEGKECQLIIEDGMIKEPQENL